MKNISNPNRPVVLFIPESGIYPFIRGLAVLGDAIVKQGGTVLITHDTGQMLRSPIIAMHRLPVNVSLMGKIFIRILTERYFKKVLAHYNFLPIELSNFIDRETMAKIDGLACSVHKNLEDIQYMGFPVGKIAQYDFVLETKFPYTSELSVEHKALFIQYIKNTALAIKITNDICQRYKPSLFLTFNEYAQCQAVKFSAKKHKIPFLALTYPVHFNIDSSRFSVWESTYQYWRYRHCQNWNKWKDTPISEQDVKACWKDSIFRMYSSGSHIFSSQKKNDPINAFNSLKLDPCRKTIVVYTSSQDERFSAEISMKIWGEENRVHDIFKNQMEWLTMLFNYAKKRNDIQIVVRIHPREGSRQFGFDSKLLKLLKDKFKKKLSNFIIVWPDDPISSYDLMELADVCLIAWSLMGQEAARLGIPVLSYTANMLYPNDDFIEIANNRKEYENKLDKLLHVGLTWEKLGKAIRFYHWRIFIPSLNLGETVPSSYDDDTVWPKVPISKIKVINNILSGKQDLIKYNIKEWVKFLPKNAITQEKMAIKYGIRYFLNAIFFPAYAPIRNKILFFIWCHIRKIFHVDYKQITENKFRDYRLKFSNDLSKMYIYIQETKNDTNLRILVADGSQAIFVCNGKLLRRMSPMVIRLAILHENN